MEAEWKEVGEMNTAGVNAARLSITHNGSRRAIAVQLVGEPQHTVGSVLRLAQQDAAEDA